MRALLLSCFLAFVVMGCDTTDRPSASKDAGSDAAISQKPNVCVLSDCPRPEMGVACCTPLAQCGMDPTGTGLACVPNDGGKLSDLVCDLKKCPKPTVGSSCCTPFAQCGFDPFNSGVACFTLPTSTPVTEDDAGSCDLDACPAADGGPSACCQANGKCGVDTLGIGVCFAPPPAPLDASVPTVSTEPPDDPSVNGECPSYLGVFGPVWGCCSDYGVCGTFQNDTCFLPVGTTIPVASDDEDAGALSFPRCNPPQKVKPVK